MTVLSVAPAASMPTARLHAAAHARASRRASPQVPPRPAGAARVAMPRPSATRVRSSASRRASSLRVRASDGGGAPSPNVADDAPGAKRTPKPLDLAAIPRPPLRLAAGLAAAGCVESSYLAFEKLTGGAVTCPLTGCQTALSSGYSVLFGVPLSAYGAAAYGLVAALAWWGAGMADAVFDEPNDDGDVSENSLASPERRADADEYAKARTLLCFSGFGLAGVSSYLLYVLAVPLGGAECVYCLTSAALSFAICAVGWSGLEPKKAASTGPASLALYAVTALSCYVVIGSSAAKVEKSARNATLALPYAAPVIDARSTAYSRDLASFLKAKGAKMYGAFWCSHCEDQKEIFGAGADLPYVECFPDGWQRGAPLASACANANITGFPTWILEDGTKLEGDKSLKELAQAAGFRAPPAGPPDADAQLDDLLG